MKGMDEIKRNRGHLTRKMMESMVESAALEDIAISKLLKAQADVIRVFSDEYGKGLGSPSNKQMNEFQGYVARIVEALTEKQKISIRRMELSRSFLDES